MQFHNCGQVKVLGVFGMIDDGETDWKVVTINVDDERAGQIEDVDDIEQVMPGTISAMRGTHASNGTSYQTSVTDLLLRSQHPHVQRSQNRYHRHAY